MSIQVVNGPTSSSSPESHELFFARRALQLLKSRLGTNGLLDLLKEDIALADQYWETKIAESKDQWRLCSITLQVPNLTTSSFLAWFRNAVKDMSVMQAAHPEHYINGFGTILETIGEHVSLFDLEIVAEPGACVTNRDAEKYPVALCGRGVLRSGKVMGWACHQFRDLEEGGFEVCFGGWMPEAIGEEVIEMQRRHLLVEWTNWLRVAQRDLGAASSEKSAVV